MGTYIAQVVFQSLTNLPKDRFVNTWHFVGGTAGVTDGELLGVANRLTKFYTDVIAGQTVGMYLSSEIDQNATINVYDFDEAPPRIPSVFHFHLPIRSSTTCLPEEIALCLSFYSTRNQPRNRGRVYLGPFNITALSTGGEVTSRPNPAMLTVIAAQATVLRQANDAAISVTSALQDGLFIAHALGALPAAPLPSEFAAFPPPEPVNWAQYSHVGTGTMPTKKAPGTPKAPHPIIQGPIGGGWVDNEWDGQSRRRIQSSARVAI